MIIGVGVDLVSIGRLGKTIERHGERARRRLFTAAELAECDSRADALECLAARLAVKEAAFKALGTGKSPGVRWTDIETTRGAGPPRVEFSGAARKHAELLGVDRAYVSLSHEAGMACAVVLLEGR